MRNSLALVIGVFLVAGVSLPASGQVPGVAPRFAVGAFTGYQWPIVQDDADPGALFGFKGRVALSPLFEFEPNIIFLNNGEVDTESGGTLEAPSVSSYAINGVLHLGTMFELTGGIGWASVETPSSGSGNEFAWNGGLGIVIPVGRLAIDVGGRLLVINTESGASRKHGLAMAGLIYRF